MPSETLTAGLLLSLPSAVDDVVVVVFIFFNSMLFGVKEILVLPIDNALLWTRVVIVFVEDCFVCNYPVVK